MTTFPFHKNKIVKFWTNYKGKEKYRNFKGDRYYFLFSIDKDEELLNFFPITYNRHDYKEYVGRYKILNRCSYLEDEKYPESFVNTDVLITVPFEAVSYLKFCSDCPSFCLKKDFEEITKLHSALLGYRIEVSKVKITIEYFRKEQK